MSFIRICHNGFSNGALLVAKASFKMISEDDKMIGNSKTTILAIGAAGRFGGFVVPELAKRGAKVRGFVRNAAQCDVARRHGVAEVAVGDLRDSASLAAALQGVGSVFYIAPAFMAGEAEVGVRIVRAATHAGVRRFVFSSVIHPTLSALVNHSAKAPVEDAILVSGMEYAFLQPTMFYQNFAEAWPEVLKTGVNALYAGRLPRGRRSGGDGAHRGPPDVRYLRALRRWCSRS